MFTATPVYCPAHGPHDPMESLMIAIALADQMLEGSPEGYAERLKLVCAVEAWAGFQQLALLLLDQEENPRQNLAMLRFGLTLPMGDM